jgi:uncharacterized membrane protein
MSTLFRFFFGVVLPLVAILIAAVAWSAMRRRSTPTAAEERIAALEEQVRGLLYRVWMLERGTAPTGAPVPAPPPPAPAIPMLSPAPPVEVPAPPTPSPVETPVARPSIDLEQRIGARWATWVGVVAILFAVGFFLKWSFENELLGPGARVVLGLVAGLALLASGVGLRRREDVPYLSEALAGLGLGILYLSLYGAHALYELIGPGLAFAAMFAVTLLGVLASVASSRQITAVLTVIGGLLTPVLLAVEQPDERNLLVYLVVLDLLVLALARFRTWPALGRVAWVGSALLVAAAFTREPDSPHPLSRLALLSALFVLFLAVPLIQPLAQRRRQAEIDLLLVAVNAAGYFWAVYMTLELWHPRAEGIYALALAVVYRLVSADYATRVPDDKATVALHEGVAWVFLTLSIPLALEREWITLAWAAQGVVLLWTASRVETPVASWGGLAALLLAAARVAAFDRYASGTVPVWNFTYTSHLLVVVALLWGGLLAGSARPDRLHALPRESVRSVLWLIGPLVLAVLLWREPSGLWPATLLTAELLVLGWLARIGRSPAWVVATAIIAVVLLARVLGADDLQARHAARALLNWPLTSRVGACAALAIAGGQLARSAAASWAPLWGRVLSGAGAVVLLFVLSQNWTRYQGGGVGWTTQVGLSILWAIYAASALCWGFVRSRASVRYAALALLGITVLKVFLVDLAAVRTVYRVLSFLVLGVVLLGVSLLYQKGRAATN